MLLLHGASKIFMIVYIQCRRTVSLVNWTVDSIEVP